MSPLLSCLARWQVGASPGQCGDGGGLQVDVLVVLETGEVLVREQNPLAANGVGWDQCFCEIRLGSKQLGPHLLLDKLLHQGGQQTLESRGSDFKESRTPWSAKGVPTPPPCRRRRRAVGSLGKEPAGRLSSASQDRLGPFSGRTSSACVETLGALQRGLRWLERPAPQRQQTR